MSTAPTATKYNTVLIQPSYILHTDHHTVADGTIFSIVIGIAAFAEGIDIVFMLYTPYGSAAPTRRETSLPSA